MYLGFFIRVEDYLTRMKVKDRYSTDRGTVETAIERCGEKTDRQTFSSRLDGGTGDTQKP